MKDQNADRIAELQSQVNDLKYHLENLIPEILKICIPTCARIARMGKDDRIKILAKERQVVITCENSLSQEPLYREDETNPQTFDILKELIENHDDLELADVKPRGWYKRILPDDD